MVSLRRNLGRLKEEPFQLSLVTVMEQTDANGSARPQSVSTLLEVKLNGCLQLLPQGGVVAVAAAALGK